MLKLPVISEHTRLRGDIFVKLKISKISFSNVGLLGYSAL